MLDRSTPGDHDDEPNPAVQGYAAGNVYTGLDLPSKHEANRIDFN